MKHLLAQTVILAFLFTSANLASIYSAKAVSISNPRCVEGLRAARTGRRHQAFAMTVDGAHCGWTTHSTSTQSKANRAALDGCKKRAEGQKCMVVWPK